MREVSATVNCPEFLLTTAADELPVDTAELINLKYIGGKFILLVRCLVLWHSKFLHLIWCMIAGYYVYRGGNVRFRLEESEAKCI